MRTSDLKAEVVFIQACSRLTHPIPFLASSWSSIGCPRNSHSSLKSSKFDSSVSSVTRTCFRPSLSVLYTFIGLLVLHDHPPGQVAYTFPPSLRDGCEIESGEIRSIPASASSDSMMKCRPVRSSVISLFIGSAPKNRSSHRTMAAQHGSCRNAHGKMASGGLECRDV